MEKRGVTTRNKEKFISDYMEITNGSIKLTGYDEKSYLKSFK